MKSKTKSMFAGKVLVWLALVTFTSVAMAQQPSPTPKKSPEPQPTVDAGEDAGDYTVIGSVEFGYRGLSVDGDHNKYQSDLNYRAGPRLFVPFVAELSIYTIEFCSYTHALSVANQREVKGSSPLHPSRFSR